jgi:hypothetical protein
MLGHNNQSIVLYRIGMLSHQLKQFEINGEKTVIQNPSENQRKENEKSTFELYEVYAIDVLLSSGEGKVSLYEIY